MMLLKELTQQPPTMWEPSIVGYALLLDRRARQHERKVRKAIHRISEHRDKPCRVGGSVPAAPTVSSIGLVGTTSRLTYKNCWAPHNGSRRGLVALEGLAGKVVL